MSLHRLIVGFITILIVLYVVKHPGTTADAIKAVVSGLGAFVSALFS